MGRWQAPRQRVLSSDWGAYSWPGDDAAERLLHYRECATEIGGHPVKLISGYDARGTMSDGGNQYVVTAVWRDVVPGTHLTLGVSAPDPADLPELLGIIRSIRFDPPEPQTP